MRMSPDFEARLVRYYRDAPPNVERQSCVSENLILWRLLQGEARVELDTLRIHAKPGDWVVLTPGARIQEFSRKTELESIHLQIRTGHLFWTGRRGCLLKPNADLQRDARAMGREAQSQGVPGRNWDATLRAATSVLGFIRLQNVVWKFLTRLLPLLNETGMELSVAEITDSRVLSSLRSLDVLPLDASWDRAKLARQTGVSASQLDRLWVTEMNRTPFQHWEARRVRFARETLENTRTSIKELASALGFDNLALFSNWFARKQGMAPRAYRAHASR